MKYWDEFASLEKLGAFFSQPLDNLARQGKI
jgi:hypothetical protein